MSYNPKRFNDNADYEAFHGADVHQRTKALSHGDEPGQTALNSPSYASKQENSEGETSNFVFSLFRNLLTQKVYHTTTKSTSKAALKDASPSSTPQATQRGPRNDEGMTATSPTNPLPFHTARQYRLKVAVVGESESGRTTLCKSLANAAENKTNHPLVASGQAAAALKMDSSVLSVQTYDVARTVGGESKGEGDVLEVTVVDSGPAPLSDGAGSTAMMEADVILLCFPLYSIKQAVPLQKNGGFDLFCSARPTEALIHSRDCQLINTLLTVVSTRCGGGRSTPLPFVYLVGTFQDVLKDASIAATHTILRALQRLCDRVRLRSSSILPVTNVFAVSATHATTVTLTSEKQFDLNEWWRVILRRAAATAQAWRTSVTATLSDHRELSQQTFSTFFSSLCHLLGHPNSLQALHAGVRQIFRAQSSPRLLNLSGNTSFLQTPGFQETVSTGKQTDDALVTSLVVDFIIRLKARKRVWMLPLPKLWRVAYALGMQTREQLYLVLRQMEATGEVTLLGRGLSYTQESCLGPCSPTNETVCLCPSLLRTSYSILYVYMDWVARRQHRHVRRCLRNISLEECNARDPKALAVKGVFPLPLLRHLAVALELKTTSTSEAAELLISVLVGSDAAYLARDTFSAVDTSSSDKAASFAAAPSSTAEHRHDLLQSPLPHSAMRGNGAAGLRSGNEMTAFTPLCLRGLTQLDPSTDELADTLSPVSSMGGDDFPELTATLAPADSAVAKSFPPNITVTELTSFSLGELTPSTTAEFASTHVQAATAAASSSLGLLANGLLDPVRAAVQRTDCSVSPTRFPHLAPKDDLVLVVPSLQPSLPCPDTVTHYILACANRTSALSSSYPALAGQNSLRSSQVLLRVDPFPYDLVSLLTCRFASLALRVHRAYSNAVLLSFSVTQLLHASTDHVLLYEIKSERAVEETADGFCFLFCATPPDETISWPTVLRLVTFANSNLRVACLEFALYTELRMFLLQRLPGMTIAPEPEAGRMGSGATVGSVTCASVDDLINSLRAVV